MGTVFDETRQPADNKKNKNGKVKKNTFVFFSLKQIIPNYENH